MASSPSLCLSKQQLLSILLIITILILTGCHKSIISFGDSLADTGNLVILSQANKPPAAFPPYGETFFKQPTGRFSDGRLVIDFFGHIISDFHWYHHKFGAGNGRNQKFLKGVNFAVAGATALENAFLAQKGIINPATNVSLGVQELMKLGAVTILVPGNLPIGCLPIYLTRFQTSNKQDYGRSTGCLTWLNDFSQYYNGMLKNELNKIRKLHPRANIVYADYYQAAIPFYRSPRQFGFNSTLTACCGGGGPYNFNLSLGCGSPATTSCGDPSSYVSWDGIHLTEATYGLISKALLDGSSTIPRLKILCASSSAASD
ncbi:hypothetical protein QQP08_019815 [Theobroma cacao]|nr:hypothetical protein QQP08_019815 [Theobroma cacao]